MWLRISPDMDFYLDIELQGVDEMTREYDVQHYERAVHDAFVERLKQAFPAEDFHIHTFEFGVAREKMVGKKAA